MKYAITSCPALMSLSPVDQTYLKSIIQQDCCSTARKSLDGLKVIVKWEGDINPLIELGINHTIYTHQEILDQIATDEWSTNEV